MRKWRLVLVVCLLVETAQVGLLQVSKAVYEGAIAGLEAIRKY